MNCDELPLEELVQGHLDEPETTAILDHVRGCETCRERLQVIALLEAEGARILERRRTFPVRHLAAAASIVLGLAGVLMTVWWWGADSGGVDGRLATREPYPYISLATRSAGQGQAQLFEQAMAEYKSGRFSEASKRLACLDPLPEVLFYLGVCEYMDGHLETAITYLERSRKASPDWRLPALWYEANAKLRLNDRAAARSLLQELQEDEGEFNQRAEQLLASIAHLD